MKCPLCKDTGYVEMGEEYVEGYGNLMIVEECHCEEGENRFWETEMMLSMTVAVRWPSGYTRLYGWGRLG